MPHPIQNRAAVLLATYNGDSYISEFLESLCAQSMKDFEVFVRDDGSTDSTLETLHEYSSRLSIHLLPPGPRLGPAKGFFRLLEEAGDGFDCYFFADQDDYWYSDKVERAMTALKGQPDPIALYCSRLEYVDQHLEHLKFSRVPWCLSINNAAVENIATGCTVAITRETRLAVITSKSETIIMHDWWLYFFCSAFGKVIYDPVPSIKYRQHAKNAIRAATSVFEDFRRRLVRLARRDGGIHVLSQQIDGFLTCFGSKLTPQQNTLLQKIIVARTRFSGRLKLFFEQPFVRQSRLDTLILRFIFLLGWF